MYTFQLIVMYNTSTKEMSQRDGNLLRRGNPSYSRIAMNILPEFDSSKFYLGALCRSGHNFADTDSTLRYISTKGCVECRTLAAKRWRTKHRDRERQYGAEYYQKNRDKVLQRHHRHYLNNKESYQRRQKAKHTGEMGKLERKLRNSRWRARCKLVEIEPYTKLDILNRFAEFSNSCAYCGSTDEIEVDHVIPFSKSGADSLNNIVPACTRCNLDKRAKDVRIWYKKQPFYSDERWERILSILAGTKKHEEQK